MPTEPKPGEKSGLRKRPRVPHVQSKVCVFCGAPEGYQTVTTTRDVELNGTCIAVTYECLECPCCGHRVLTGPQLDARLRQTAGLRAGKTDPNGTGL